MQVPVLCMLLFDSDSVLDTGMSHCPIFQTITILLTEGLFNLGWGVRLSLCVFLVSFCFGLVLL